MCDISQRKNYPAPEWKEKCLRCGYCCQKGPCPYAEWDRNKPYKCIFLELTDESLGIHSCKIMDKIWMNEAESDIPPMFDNYCSSPFMNDVREEVIRKIKKANNANS